MSKHTPGPWWFARGDHDGFNVGQGDHALFETVPPHQCPLTRYAAEHVEANARLAAAAPELLAALQRFVTSESRAYCTDRKGDCAKAGRRGREPSNSLCIACEARAAIAKAEGGGR